jgi:hypothetical protein
MAREEDDEKLVDTNALLALASSIPPFIVTVPQSRGTSSSSLSLFFTPPFSTTSLRTRERPTTPTLLPPLTSDDLTSRSDSRVVDGVPPSGKGSVDSMYFFNKYGGAFKDDNFKLLRKYIIKGHPKSTFQLI